MAMNKQKQFPKWMLKKCSENDRDSVLTSLQNSKSTSRLRSTAGNPVRAKKTLYCMTEKELEETAKEILYKADKDHSSDDKTLKSEASSQKQFNKSAKINKTLTSGKEYLYEDLFSTEESEENEADTKGSKIIHQSDLSELDRIFF